MVGAGFVLADSQDRSRRTVAARVQGRMQYAAAFISIYARDLMAREQAAARSWFATAHVSQAILERAASALGLSAAVLLDGRWNAIATLPSGGAATDAALVHRYAGLAAGGASGSGASRISLTDVQGVPLITFAVTYQTASGRRVFTGAYAMSDTVLPTVLGHLLSTSDWQAYLVDSQGTRLTAGRQGPPEGPQAHFAAAVDGTSWRIVVRDPESQLYGFLSGGHSWLPWLALSALAVAGLAAIVLFVRLQRRRVQLSALNGELARLATIDPLTGLRNRRAIEEYLHDAVSSARRHGLDLSLLVIDVDHFKSFNDTLGHRGGDAVLVHAARVLDRALRTEDAIGRWGGEEFLVVLPGTDEEGAVHATERLRAALAGDQVEEARAHGLRVTITIGAAEWYGETADELVSRADRALYIGKAAGRDTVQLAGVAGEVAEAGGPV
jgi:diguanylate cyclase (GGDEF)-like protein